jgi:hypothetical protein
MPLSLLRRSHGAYYELGSGSALGGVKLSNFIPWDLDMDIRKVVLPLSYSIYREFV